MVDPETLTKCLEEVQIRSMAEARAGIRVNTLLLISKNATLSSDSLVLWMYIIENYKK